MSSQLRLWAGETDVAIEQMETSMRLDPMGPNRPNQVLLMGIARFQQRRFSEAVTLLREFVHQTDGPTGYAYLAASYGHLGEQATASDALARFRSLSPRGFDLYARTTIGSANHRKLFLDGIALAEGMTPSEAGDGE